MKLESHVNAFVSEWSSLKNKDVFAYLREGMAYVSNSNLDIAQCNQLLDFAEDSYLQTQLVLLDDPVSQNNRIAAQWALTCSQAHSGLVIPETLTLSGADFVRSFQGKIKEVDVYFNFADVATIHRLLSPQHTSATSVHANIESIAGINPTKSAVPQYQKSGLSHAAIAAIAEQIQQVMQVQRVYLDGDITLTKLSQHINIKSHYVSQVISQHFGSSFFQLLAKYRIEEAKRRLRESHNTTVLEVGLGVGFNSKSVFYNEFRKHTGFTPSQYRKSLKNG